MRSTAIGFPVGAAATRRDGQRRAVLIPATIRCPDGESISCILRDMSPCGAKLSVSRRHRLPQTFTLTVPGHDTCDPVRRVWQRADTAGVVLALPTTGETRHPRACRRSPILGLRRDAAPTSSPPHARRRGGAAPTP
ncbi:PilZ domain-containing protein [Methylobacterium sp. J-072]|uniref:PilZ domain-containing protein n=1 Tax=Methylobacterium sp. J-072 TaxID=2836651 RepID=UPI00391B9940